MREDVIREALLLQKADSAWALHNPLYESLRQSLHAECESFRSSDRQTAHPTISLRKEKPPSAWPAARFVSVKTQVLRNVDSATVSPKASRIAPKNS
jgi:hypothetical protein